MMRKKKLRASQLIGVGVFVVFLIVMLNVCSGDKKELEPSIVTTPEPEPQLIQTEDSSSKSVVVRADEYGDRWPLTVSEARVELIGRFVAILHAEGDTYALNGTAQSEGYAPIDPIWRDSQHIPGTKVSISPLIKRALSLAEAITFTPSLIVPSEPEPTAATPRQTESSQDTLGGSIGETVEAWVAAQQYVEKQLISPSTAKFNGVARSPYVVYLGDARYRVTATVDSQNNFGAMIRTEFEAIVRAKRDDHQTWILESLEF